MTERRYVHLTNAQLRARLNDMKRQVASQREVYENLLSTQEQLVDEVTRRVEG